MMAATFRRAVKRNSLCFLLAALFSLVGATSAYALSPYVIAYGNGIANSFEEAQTSRVALKTHYGTSAPDGGQILYVNAFATSVFDGCDLYEVYLQKHQPGDSWGEFWKIVHGFVGTLSPTLTQAVDDALAACASTVNSQMSGSDYTDADLENQVALYRGIITGGRRVLIVAHSQGNLYANLAYSKIKKDSSLPNGNNIAIVAVASPANSVADKRATDIWETSGSDLVIRATPDALGPTFHFPGEPANVLLFPEFNRLLTGDRRGHNFQDVYIKTGLISWERIETQMDRGLEYLAASNQPPAASFTVTPAQVSVNQQVTFDPSASSDSDGHIIRWEWDLGNGGPGLIRNDPTPASVTIAYSDPGVKTVKLTVTDDGGATNTAIHSFNVTGVNQPPIATFTASATRVAPNQPITFDPSASRDPDGTIRTYDWDFGDGQVASFGSAQIASHSYASNGIYTVKLTVTDNVGSTAQAMRTIMVSSLPAPADAGVLLTDVSAAAGCSQVLPQGDKFIVTARLGNGAGGYTSDFGHVLVRYDANGIIDSSFGIGGIAAISNTTPGLENVYGGSDLCIGTVDGLGRIILSSAFLQSIGDTNVRAQVIRLTPDGAVDASFGDHGVFRFDNARYQQLVSTANRVTTDSANRVIVAGQSGRLNCPFSTCFWEGLAFRINASGSMDESFNGGQGIFTWTDPVLGFQPFVHSYFTGVSVDSTDRILLGGCTHYCANYEGEAYVVRLTNAGALDASFGTQGSALVPLYSAADPTLVTSAPGYRAIRGISFELDGRILATGANCFAICAALIYRLDSNGVLDPTFTYGGGAFYNFGYVQPFMAAPPVAQFSRDSKITLVGTTVVTYYDDYVAVGRLRFDGSPDPTFNVADVTYPSTPAQRTWHLALGNTLCGESPGGAVFQAGGKVVIGGSFGCNGPAVAPYSGLYLLRFSNDGSIDPTFGQ
jgi:uncharacterized delta-60 repeat protein